MARVNGAGHHRMNCMACTLFGLAILLAIIVPSINRWRVDEKIAVYAIALIIAIIPEGRVVVMALGVGSMASSHGILAALEALGSVTTICVDKARQLVKMVKLTALR